MKRLAAENINTPEHFDQVWKMEGVHSFDRVRMEAFTDYVQPGMKVLDVGAGVFGWAEYMLTFMRLIKGEVHALDFSQTAAAMVSVRCPELLYQVGDVLSMPYPNEYFDLVGAGELIEHMESPDALVTEMARVTRPGGLMIIGTVDPNCEDSVRNRVEYPEHLWEFTPGEVLALVAEHGKSWYQRVGNYDFVYCRRS